MEKGVGLPEGIWEAFACKEQDIRAFSPLTLAYLGDCVYELVIRTVLVEGGNRSTEKLHREASAFSKAGAQCRIYEALLPVVTKEEADILKRGKNARFHTKAKNATVNEYKCATALEALFGYLYLDGRMERVLELLRQGIEKCGLSDHFSRREFVSDS